MEQSGTVDFYANSGMRQPGCPDSFQLSPATLSDLYSTFMTSVVNCNHLRAIFLFNEALLQESCQFVGYECRSYSAFNQVRPEL